MLCRVLVFTPEIRHLSGEVSRKTWKGVSRVVLVVAKHRRHPLTVSLCAVDFSISREEATRYVEAMRRVMPESIMARWNQIE